MQLLIVDERRLDEAVDTLCDAFADYPVMQFVIGQCGASYAARLRHMIQFFTAARLLNDDLVLAVADEHDDLVAVANISRPGTHQPAPALDVKRDALWRELGAPARARYEQLGGIWRTFALEPPHYHLNMIGVRRAHHGRGAARRLLEAVHERSAQTPESCGVSLTTETAANVPLYRRFGYQVTGHAVVVPGLETWSFFRPDPGGDERRASHRTRV